MKFHINSSIKLFLISVSILFHFQVFAHGSFEQPISRVYSCYLEGPENPMSEACQEAVNVGGTQALYDWNEVNQGKANGNHQAIIPDGTLCAGGRDKYRGLNLARSDWLETPISSNSENGMDFVYYATAPHSSEYFRFYVTKDSYDLNQPLGWNDLDPAFCNITSVTLDSDNRYRMNCPLPLNKFGKHIIYSIWQRGDSPEAFYACIDVDFIVSSDLIFKNSFELNLMRRN